MVRAKVSILLSTYNSEAYLSEQIDSVINQTTKDWILYIRDDGSSDNTISLIEDYCRRYDNIIFLKDGLANLGSKKSFINLLTQVDSSYYMFCDHDDVWLPFKIEKTLNKMLETESAHPGKPVLIFTDLIIVDNNLNILNNSMWTYQKTNPEHAKDFYLLSVSNPVTGCTVMINQRAKEISLPMSQKSLMHDLWIALKVSYYGNVDFISEPTVLYRQHANNVIGAKKTDLRHYLSGLTHLSGTIMDNIRLIQMINSLGVRINHYKRLVLKMKVVKGRI
jgi:glycosyltransferase involved in cell wall biosynthesis